MQRMKIAARSRQLAGLALLLLTVSGCVGAPLKPTLKDRTPIAGCSERAAGLSPPPPPESDLPELIAPDTRAVDWAAEYRRLYAVADGVVLDWIEAYTGAVRANTSNVKLRTNTADCLDAHRKPPTFWQRLFG